MSDEFAEGLPITGIVISADVEGCLCVRVALSTENANPLPKIFVWVNGGRGTEWQSGAALAEDGTWLCGHISSCRGWFQHDMGLASENKHEIYRAHYPAGFELVEVPEGEERKHEGLEAAHALHLQKATASPEAVQS